MKKRKSPVVETKIDHIFLLLLVSKNNSLRGARRRNFQNKKKFLKWGADVAFCNTFREIFQSLHPIVYPYQWDGSRSHKKDDDELTKIKYKKGSCCETLYRLFRWKQHTDFGFFSLIFLFGVILETHWHFSNMFVFVHFLLLLIVVALEIVYNVRLNRILALRTQKRINYWKSKRISDWYPHKIRWKPGTTATKIQKKNFCHRMRGNLSFILRFTAHIRV